MSKDNCIFCKIVAGEIPSAKIYEDDAVLAFLDVGPVSDGHTLVIPKLHFEKLHECPVEILSCVTKCFGKVAKAVVVATGCDGYNVLCNNGRAAGQLVEHLHFHIIPRYDNDDVFSKWPSYKYEQGQIESIAESIRKNL
ncbi:MAG: HIT family protein [Planctomycetes bacterium]|nr:HIT family protein [Planctomycetota bacterium]